MNSHQTDLLTGLNRKSLLEEMFLQLVKQRISRFAIIFIDIDHFAYCNYHYGHLQGDEILKQIAETILQQIPPNVKAFRIGGDEFVILFNESNSTEVISIAEKIRELTQKQFSQIMLKRDYISQTFESSLTVSCGIAFYPDNGDELDTLLAAADQAMYEKAKILGGNKVVLASSI